MWANVADGLLGFKRLTYAETLAQITSISTTVRDNKANPRYVLTPMLYFQYPHENTDARQCVLKLRAPAALIVLFRRVLAQPLRLCPT